MLHTHSPATFNAIISVCIFFLSLTLPNLYFDGTLFCMTDYFTRVFSRSGLSLILYCSSFMTFYFFLYFCITFGEKEEEKNPIQFEHQLHIHGIRCMLEIFMQSACTAITTIIAANFIHIESSPKVNL